MVYYLTHSRPEGGLHLSPMNGSAFLHRQDTEGMYHVFCRICFLTVAKCEREADLANAGNGHKCSGPPTFPLHRYPYSETDV